MNLYVKNVSKNGKVSYSKYLPPDNSQYEIEQDQMVTLICTLLMAMVISIENQYPNHSKVHRELTKVENAICNLAKLNAKPLDEVLVNIGVKAWNDSMKSMQEGLQ